LMLTGLISWNHEAWIVQRNVARFAATRQFDARYAVWSLSLNAVPALIAALEKLPPDAAGLLRFELTKRHGSAPQENLRWYEWNLRRARAQRALSTWRAPGAPHVPNSTSARMPPSGTRDSSAR
jgi:hypothetical protein